MASGSGTGPAARVRTTPDAQRYAPPRCRSSWPAFQPGQEGTAITGEEPGDGPP
jgi:hypothetical protein